VVGSQDSGVFCSFEEPVHRKTYSGSMSKMFVDVEKQVKYSYLFRPKPTLTGYPVAPRRKPERRPRKYTKLP
jgi:hypothetical protein